tara:strand:+ start:689 stop:895 length:207 start_codon:yes stop_codon:yes gene_type:complete
MKVIKSSEHRATVAYNNNYYVVSYNKRKNETLVFPSDSNGEIRHYIEVGGGYGISLSEILQDFSSFLH